MSIDNIVYTMAFETRRPVIGKEFYDREELIERLVAQMKSHLVGRSSWIALLGPRKIGKTSVLRELQRYIHGKGTIIVTLDLFRVDARVQEVFTAFIGALLVGVSEFKGHSEIANRLKTRPFPIEAGLSHILSTTLPAPCVGKALSLIEELRQPQITNAQVTEILELPEQFAQEYGPLWFVLDEVQELDALNRQKPFSKRHTVFRLMRSIWQGQSKVSYWATGSQVSMLSKLFTDRRSPFHGHFQVLSLGSFSTDVAAKLLIEGTPTRRHSSDTFEAAKLAAQALGGHPFYMQVLGEELELRRVKLTLKSVKSVLQEILLTPTGRLALHLHGVLEADAGSGKQVSVLRALARGEATLSEFMAKNPLISRESTHSTLRRLEGADLVVRDPTTRRFRVADPALASYLRVGGLSAEPSPTVLGDEGEKTAARHLLTQGLRPVYQSYQSLGPADLVVLEGSSRFAIQVKRSQPAVYIKEVEYQRLLKWSKEQKMTPLLCQVSPDDPKLVHYFLWSDARKTGRLRCFDKSSGKTSVFELLE